MPKGIKYMNNKTSWKNHIRKQVTAAAADENTGCSNTNCNISTKRHNRFPG